MIGLAVSDGEALKAAKSIYSQALSRMEELCAPYADVIDIKTDQLPTAEEESLLRVAAVGAKTGIVTVTVSKHGTQRGVTPLLLVTEVSPLPDSPWRTSQGKSLPATTLVQATVVRINALFYLW